METDVTPVDFNPSSIGRWLRRGQRGLMTICALAVLYYWFWVTTNWLAFGFNPRIWPAVGGTLVSLTGLVGLAAFETRRGSQDRGRIVWIGILTLGWTMASAISWYAFCSPFSRAPSIAAGYSLSTWWLLWAWAMFFASRYWKTRLSLLAVMLAMLGVFLSSVQAAGWDGDALPKVVWRFQSRDKPEQNIVAVASLPALDAIAPAKLDNDSAYPRFRGADGLATVRDARLARNWSEQTPIVRWRHPLGLGWSGFAVAFDLAITQEQRGEQECVVAYDRHSGQERWVHQDPAHYQFPGTGDGPRATPTIDSDRVYTCLLYTSPSPRDS